MKRHWTCRARRVLSRRSLSKISRNITNIHITLDTVGYYSKVWMQYSKPPHTLSTLPVKNTVYRSGPFIQQMMEGVKDIVSSMESSSETAPKTSALTPVLSHLTQYLYQTTGNTFIPRFIAKFTLPTTDQRKRGREEGKCCFS